MASYHISSGPKRHGADFKIMNEGKERGKRISCGALQFPGPKPVGSTEGREPSLVFTLDTPLLKGFHRPSWWSRVEGAKVYTAKNSILETD